MHRPILSALAAVLAIAAIASPAAAETWGPATDTQRVSYADINLDTPRGAQEMLARIEVAARNVCDVRNAPRPLYERLIADRCVRSTVSSTVATMHNPMLTASYQGRDTFTFASAR